MTKSNNMTNLLDQLKIQVLLYSGTLIEYDANDETLTHLLAAGVALKRTRIDQLLLSVEREAKACGCSTRVAPLLAKVHTRSIQ